MHIWRMNLWRTKSAKISWVGSNVCSKAYFQFECISNAPKYGGAFGRTLSYISFQYMSYLMTKPTEWLCAQWRLRSAWASTQSDQSLLSAWRKLGSFTTYWAHSKDWSDWVDAQAEQSLRWAHSHFAGFVTWRLILIVFKHQWTEKNLKRSIGEVFYDIFLSPPTKKCLLFHCVNKPQKPTTILLSPFALSSIKFIFMYLDKTLSGA